MARKYWWPSTLPAQLAVMVNVQGKIASYQSTLGLTVGQVAAIQHMCETFIAVYNWVEATRETTKSVIEWRDDYFYNVAGGAPPTEPFFNSYTAPAIPANAGIVNLFKQMRDLIVNMAGFTEAIGEDLMFLGEESSSVIPGLVQPTVKVTPSATGYLASVVVSDRESADMWEVWTLNKGAATWVKGGTYAGKSADITFTPTTPGEPYQFQLRIQLRKSNANYGQPSDAVTATVTP